MKRVFLCIVGVAVLLFGACLCEAGLLYVPNTYGTSARGIGMGNAMTALSDEASLLYYNPASMAQMTKGQIEVSYIYTQPNFEGGLKKGEKKKFDVPNELIYTAFAIPLSGLLKSNRRIVFGFDVLLEENGKAFIRFNDLAYEEGYYYRYGRSSFSINGGLGFEIVEWFFLGGGFLSTLHGTTDFYVKTDLAGNTDKEGMKLDADVILAPTAAMFLKFDPVHIGLTYHGMLYGKFGPIVVDAEATVGESELAELPMYLSFKDTYIPANINLGVAWQMNEDWLLSLNGIWYNWGHYDEEMTKDDLVRDDIGFDFVDTYVPKVGVEYQVVENLFLRFGYSYEQSPVRRPGSDGFIVLDNDKHIGSFGLGYDFRLGLLTYPMSIDAAFFHHYMVPRELESEEGVDFESEGNLNGGVATIALHF